MSPEMIKAVAVYELIGLLKTNGSGKALVREVQRMINENDLNASDFKVAPFVETLRAALARKEKDNSITLGRIEEETLRMLSPMTAGWSYLALREVPSVSVSLTATVVLLLSLLHADVSGFAEDVLDLDRPHRTATAAAQLLRVALFGNANATSALGDDVDCLPDVLGPLSEVLKPLKVALLIETNASPAPASSGVLLDQLAAVQRQVRAAWDAVGRLVRHLDASLADEVEARDAQATAKQVGIRLGEGRGRDGRRRPCQRP